MTDSNRRAKSTTTPIPGDDDAVYGARYYDHQLHRKHWFHNNTAKRELRWREVLHMLDLTKDDGVLEIGCAAGAQAVRLAGLCREVVGIDLSTAAIERAIAHAAAAHVSNARFFRLDASSLTPFPDASFDKVAAIDFTEHVDDEALVRVLREVRRVLRGNGRLAIFTPCASHYVERLKEHSVILKQLPEHIAVRGPAAYRRLLLQSEFSISSLYYSPSTYPLFGKLDRWFANTPMIGPLFRFRICIVARPTIVS